MKKSSDSTEEHSTELLGRKKGKSRLNEEDWAEDKPKKKKDVPIEDFVEDDFIDDSALYKQRRRHGEALFDYRKKPKRRDTNRKA